MARRTKNKPELTDASARDKALRALARREHSAAELRQKLEYRGLAGDAAAAVVDNLRQSGWQSDERFAETLVRSRIAQAYGPLRIQAELEHAGVSSMQIRAAMDAAEPNWPALAAQLQVRRFGRLPKGPADWQKQYRYLAGRGFTPEQVRAALRVRHCQISFEAQNPEE